ncbi:uncharacterized protein LOC106713207 [Papilio machaon]|uniref:uncharacterized protein LOC106713207 n=1 Tax=Papilio machaon TaxID=76193 RepID=UPI001E66353B|nr:uncharacterized protein LOC106713207 [Papilio machaon]
MTKCSFKFCKSVKPQHPKNDGMLYFRFPKHLIRREKWIEVVRRQREEPSFEPNTASLVCSKHFNKGDFYTTGKGTSRLRDTAVPIIDPVNLNATTIEDENKLGDDICTQLNEVQTKPNTTKLIYQYSINTKDSSKNFDPINKMMKKDTSDLDMLFEENDNTKFSNYENPFLPSTSYNSGSSDNDEGIGKIIKIEFKESSNNSEEDKNDLDDNSIEDRNKMEFTRTRDLDKFGEHVAAMLKRIPLQRALDLQPRILKLITSVMNDDDQTTVIEIEDELYGDGN